MGIFIGIAKGLKISLIEISPLKWKKRLNLIRKEKEDSIELAKTLYPNYKDQLTKSKDGRAEAILIGHYYLQTKDEGVKSVY